jgi:ABC-type transporter MlaC component
VGRLSTDHNRHIGARKTCLSLMICLLSLMPAYAGQGQDTVDALLKIFSNWTGSISDRVAYTKISDYINYTTMSERVLGALEWNRLSAAQKNEFSATFRRLIEKRYYPRWHKLFCTGKVTFLKEKNVNGDLLVATRLKTGTDSDAFRNIAWTLGKSGGEYKVINLNVNGKDLVDRVSVRFQKKLSKGTFNDLLAWMRKQTVRSQSNTDEADNDSPSI